VGPEGVAGVGEGFEGVLLQVTVSHSPWEPEGHTSRVTGVDDRGVGAGFP